MEKNKFEYKEGTQLNLASIAQLHAQSWQTHYRGSFSDDYLDGPVFHERLDFWRKRLAKDDQNRYIILAESEEHLAGFGCLLLNDDPKWGSLIDNIHVSGNYKGQGIGRKLMDLMMQYILEHTQSIFCYLWVLTKNKSAIAFYEKLGGKIVETKEFNNPGGGQSEVFRIAWN